MSGTSASGAGLPSYTVRRSERARRVRLRVTPHEGLVVTVPLGTPDSAARDAVRAKVAWARRALADVDPQLRAVRLGPDGLLPDRIDLPALGEVWPVEYRPAPVRTVRARPEGGSLALTGDVADARACLDAVRRWHARVGREALPAMVHERAEEFGVHPARVTVRGQRTRWGSCSSAGTISLNRNLLFLPEHLVDHVIAHEIAHLVHRDHSPRFHALLRTWRPGAPEHRLELKEAWRDVPAWAL